jgi:hypothetical protein
MRAQQMKERQGWVSAARRERPGSALMSVTVHQVALALRVSPPLSRVDSLGIACSVRLA